MPAAALSCAAPLSSPQLRLQPGAASGSGGASAAVMSGLLALVPGQRSSRGASSHSASSRLLSQPAGSERRSARSASQQGCGWMPPHSSRVRAPVLAPAARVQPRRQPLASVTPSASGVRRLQQLQQAAAAGSGSSEKGSSVLPTSQQSGAAGSAPLCAAATARRQRLHQAAGVSGLLVVSGGTVARRRVRQPKSGRSGTIAPPAASGKSATQVRGCGSVCACGRFAGRERRSSA